jgi:gas vesicle protein
MSTGKIVVGALAGLAVGAIAGILFAPASGQRTRRRIMDKGEDYVDQMKDTVNGYMDKAKAGYEELIHSSEQVVKDGKEKYDGVMTHAKSLIS